MVTCSKRRIRERELSSPLSDPSPPSSSPKKSKTSKPVAGKLKPAKKPIFTNRKHSYDGSESSLSPVQSEDGVREAETTLLPSISKPNKKVSTSASVSKAAKEEANAKLKNAKPQGKDKTHQESNFEVIKKEAGRTAAVANQDHEDQDDYEDEDEDEDEDDIEDEEEASDKERESLKWCDSDDGSQKKEDDKGEKLVDALERAFEGLASTQTPEMREAMTQINEFVDEAVQGFDGKEMKKLLQARLASEQKLYKDSIDGWEEDNAKLDQINAEINVVAARAQGLLTQQRELVTKTQQEVDELYTQHKKEVDELVQDLHRVRAKYDKKIADVTDTKAFMKNVKTAFNQAVRLYNQSSDVASSSQNESQ